MNNHTGESLTVFERYPRKQLLLIGCLLFVVICAVYLIGFQYNKAGDTKPYELLPVTLFIHGDFDYDEFWIGQRQLPYYYKRVDGRLLSAFNIIPGILNLPVFGVAHLIGIDIMEHRYLLTKITVSIISAMTALFLFFCLTVQCKRLKTVILFVFIFAFCTCMWSIASTGMWKQTVTTFFCTIGILSFMVERRWTFGVAGLFFASAIAIRPPLVIYVFPCLLYLLLKKRRLIPYFLLGTMIVGLGMLFYSYNFLAFKKEKVILSKLSFGLITFEKDEEAARPLLKPRPSHKEVRGEKQVRIKSPKEQKQQKGKIKQTFLSRNGLDNNFFVGITGILFSPSRGLFFYSPLLLLGLGGLFLSFRSQGHPLLPFLSSSILLDFILLSFYQRWYGGCCFGYRLLLETVPILILLSAIFWERYCVRLFFCRIILGLFLLYSVFVQFLGVYYYPSDFCYVPNKIDYNRERLWDFPDTEITRLFVLFIEDVQERF